MKTEQIAKGVAVNEVMRDWAFENHLRKLAEQREWRLNSKKGSKKEACTNKGVQTSEKEILLNKYTTEKARCQASLKEGKM